MVQVVRKMLLMLFDCFVSDCNDYLLACARIEEVLPRSSLRMLGCCIESATQL